MANTDTAFEAYFTLAEDHLRGRLPEQVSESFLRDRYDLTRAQLTALLSRAAQEGWVERRRGYGWAFSPVLNTPESLDQTYRLRLALEPAAPARADLLARLRRRRAIARRRGAAPRRRD